MSTKTNFKRIALVAVAALGMGVLSSVPSQAAPVGLSGSAISLSATAGTAGLTGAKSDSTTAGTVSVSVLVTAVTDSLTVTAVGKSKPALQSSYPSIYFMLADTATSTGKTRVAASYSSTLITAPYGNTDTGTVMGLQPDATANVYIGAKFLAYMDSVGSTRVAGTYTYSVLASLFSNAAASSTHAQQTVDITFTIAEAAADVKTIVPGSSTAFIGTATDASTDLVLNSLATASTTPAAYLRVNTYNANGNAQPESITATITGAGILSFGGISGGSLTVAGTGSSSISVLPDGRSGVATITISTTTRTFPAKTMSFYAAAPKTLTASVPTPNLAIGSNSDAIRVTAVDANGVNWAGAVYVYASTAADALIAGSLTTPVLCTWSSTNNFHSCPVTAAAAGTAKFKAIDASTVAAATVTSNEVSAVVNTNSVATVKLSFDKTTYAPGERARIYVTPLDSAGKEIAYATYANLLAAGGISTASALTFAGSTTTADSLTAVAITTKANSSSTTGAKAGSMEYTVYMPVAGGTVTISATGGSSLPIAGRVAVTASATVTDSGAAALAAVSALATTVASLRTLITTLTNLVLKIQKKVKA
jgi:hypothetical protein